MIVIIQNKNSEEVKRFNTDLDQENDFANYLQKEVSDKGIDIFSFNCVFESNFKVEDLSSMFEGIGVDYNQVKEQIIKIDIL